jgi:hypothetical protein
LKKFFSNCWVVGISCSVIAFFITSVITAINKKINIIQAIIHVFYWILDIFTCRIPLYMVIIIILLLIIVFKIYSVFNNMDYKPKWLNYTKEQYKDWFMKWEYELTYYNKYRITNLRPVCECGCDLSNNYNLDYRQYHRELLVCPKCEKTYPHISESIVENFQKILDYNIRNENYPKTVNN